MDDIHVSWRSVDEMLKRALKMITDHERFLVEVKRTSGEGLQSIRNEYKSLENFRRTLEDDDKVIQQITSSYSEVLRVYPSADTNGEMRVRIKELNLRWEGLNATFNESLKNVNRKLILVFSYERFVLVEIYVECSWRFSINTRFIIGLVDRFGCIVDES